MGTAVQVIGAVATAIAAFTLCNTYLVDLTPSGGGSEGSSSSSSRSSSTGGGPANRLFTPAELANYNGRFSSSTGFQRACVHHTD